jgi:hypothetical protein
LEVVMQATIISPHVPERHKTFNHVYYEREETRDMVVMQDLRELVALIFAPMDDFVSISESTQSSMT